MQTLVSYLFALQLLGTPLVDDHAVYISVVEIREGRLQVKVFSDDLQNAIRNYDSNFRSVSDEQFCFENRASIENYFGSTLRITINDEQVAFSYASATKEGDSYRLSFDMPDMGIWTSIEVDDRHFMELFPSQTNIVKIMGSKQRFCKLTLNKSACQFPF